MAGKDTVYDDIFQFQGRYGGCYITWVNDSVANNGDSLSSGVVFLVADLSHYFCISNLFSSICRYIFIFDNPESLCSCYPLFLDTFVPCPNDLAQPSQFIEIGFFPFFWYLGWCRRWRYSIDSHVFELRTGMARAITGVEQRIIRASVKYSWEAQDGVTRRACFNFMDRLAGGYELRVWDMVRRAMG